jgi:peptidyl-prolyl cis-trans isomerase SurA
MVQQFEEMMLSLDLNIISEVFKTDYGYHFLEVLGTRNFDKTTELIEDRAYSSLYSRKFDEELENTLRSIRAEAFVEIKVLD